MNERRSTVRRDLVSIAMVAVVFFVLAVVFDAFETFTEWARQFERFEVDEVISSLPVVLAVAFAIISYRRWRESRREIAGRERTERELKRLNEDLEGRRRELEARTVELGRANRELRQRNEENEMFVYSVSHDLRSPLVNLQGFSQELSMVGEDLRELLAREDLPGYTRERGTELVDEDMETSVRFNQTGVSRLSNIIDALLRLSRAGRVEYRWQALEIGPIVERVVSAARGTAEEKGARIVVGPLPPAYGDATAVEQIFANLVSNALKYLDPERPGEIEVGGDRFLGTGEAGDSVPHAYYVRDNGRGIPEQHQAKVFQIFQRLHPETEGEGLGLTLVRRMVERHGGRNWVESVEGEGSTFFVQLPGAVVDEPSPAASARSTLVYRDM